MRFSVEGGAYPSVPQPDSERRSGYPVKHIVLLDEGCGGHEQGA